MAYPNFSNYAPYNMNFGNGQDYQGLIDRMEEQIKQMRQFQQQRNQFQAQQPIPQVTQNFQLAPTQNQTDFDGKYANGFDDVKNTLTLKNTFFVNKEMNMLWFKNTAGDIKTFSLTEIVDLDPRDKEIAELKQQVSIMQEMIAANNKKEEFKQENSADKPTEQMAFDSKIDKKKKM